jgi:hypothetical protein
VSKAQKVPLGHVVPVGPPHPGSSQGFGVEAAMPYAWRQQSLKYVIPSQPQTGASVASQLTGGGRHVPLDAPQEESEQ